MGRLGDLLIEINNEQYEEIKMSKTDEIIKSADETLRVATQANREASEQIQRALKYITIVKKNHPKTHQETLDEMDDTVSGSVSPRKGIVK